MPESEDDSRLHDLVRRAARQQPAYDKADWEAMRRKLHDKNPRRPGGWWAGLFALLFVGGLTWLVENAGSGTNPTENTQVAARPKAAGQPQSVASQIPEKLPKTLAPPSEGTAHRTLPLRRLQKQPSDSTGERQTMFNLQISTVADRNFTVPTDWFLESLLPKSLTTGSLSGVVVLKPNDWVERDIRRRLEQRVFGPDSTTSRALERNKNRWRNVVIVCDFTSSMYPHATELFAWLEQNRRNRYIKGAVFFTDCDSTGRETHRGGNPGQLYTVRNWRETDILPIFIAASRNTLGNIGLAENDLEAVLHAQRQFPEAESFVLIADNSSPVKDMHLLAQIKKPVRVMLCGANKYDLKTAIQPDYLKIAAATHGSLHTLTTDLPDVTKIKRGTKIRFGEHTYRYRRGRFVQRR
ncbi:MAG: hypothetical protein MUD08_13690 [Cytophagales bacterium]|nr:hypothetical protein [Cytophagales bacterium]